MPEDQALAVFVKAPLAGQVKTRLAADIGAVRAAHLYRRLGRRTIKAMAAEDYRTVVWYAPRGGARAVRAWLRNLRVLRFRPQPDGDLGERMVAALAGHFREGARRVVVVGSDCPDIDRAVIGEAFVALDTHDVVLGPARDGGYYLIGMKALHSSLFWEISWSSPTVLRETEARAGALGLSWHLLRRLRDVDMVADARALGLLPRRLAERSLEPAGEEALNDPEPHGRRLLDR